MKRAVLLFALLVVLVVGVPSTATVEVGYGVKYANGDLKQTVFGAWDSSNLAISANVMQSGSDWKVTLWEGKVDFGSGSYGPYAGVRAVYANVSGPHWAVGGEAGVWVRASLGDWMLKGRLGLGRVGAIDRMIVWDAGVRTNVGNLTFEVGVQQNRHTFVETWPRVAITLAF